MNNVFHGFPYEEGLNWNTHFDPVWPGEEFCACCGSETACSNSGMSGYGITILDIWDGIPNPNFVFDTFSPPGHGPITFAFRIDVQDLEYYADEGDDDEDEY